MAEKVLTLEEVIARRRAEIVKRCIGFLDWRAAAAHDERQVRAVWEEAERRRVKAIPAGLASFEPHLLRRF